MNNIQIVGDNAFIADTQAAVITTEAVSRQAIEEANDPIEVSGCDIVPWGEDNDLPQRVIEKVEKAEVLSSNLLFNILVGYGQGLKPMHKKIVNGKAVFHEFDPENEKDAEVLDFFELNDIDGYFLEQNTDLTFLLNTFPELRVNGGGDKITKLKSLEATFSRWGSVNTGETRIMRHYYCPKWDDSPTNEDITETKVLDRFELEESLKEYIKADKPKNYRYIYPIVFPTPGRNYYQRPYWWSIFNSGWYDFLIQIPKLKKQMIQNQLGVRYIVYIHPDYWSSLFEAKKINPDNTEKVNEVKTEELKNINDFIAGEKATGKGVISSKNYRPTSSGVSVEKMIEFEELPRAMKEGELIADSEEASNIVSYATLTHSSLLGSTPGKNSGSLSGSDKNELFNIKVALMAPFVSRIIRPLYFIKRFNGWPKDTVFINPIIVQTTKDENTSGNELKNKE